MAELRINLRRVRGGRERLLSLGGDERKTPNAGRCIGGSGTAEEAIIAGWSIPKSRAGEIAKHQRFRKEGTAANQPKTKLRASWP
jgi:hypothetical protein